MRYLLSFTALTGAFALALPAQAQEGAAAETNSQKANYIIGAQIGASLKRDGVALDSERFVQGLKDAFEGKDLRFSRDEMQGIMQALQAEVQQRMAAEAAVAGDENLKAGQEYLAANGKKEGVVTTESGLQYLVLTKGTGPKPKLEDKISAHYHGTLIDGTVFDSSVQRGEPASFPVSGVIKGWTEALQLMTVGSKWRLFIPADLAYGENPRPGGPIGPNETLVFDVELLGIE